MESICPSSRPAKLILSSVIVVLSTNETHEIKEFIEKAFGHVGIKLAWQGEGVDEVARNEATQEIVVRIDPK